MVSKYRANNSASPEVQGDLTVADHDRKAKPRFCVNAMQWPGDQMKGSSYNCDTNLTEVLQVSHLAALAHIFLVRFGLWWVLLSK